VPNKPEPIYGRIPVGWDLLELRDLISDGKAALQTGPFGTMLHASAYVFSGTPVVAVKNIGDNCLVHDDLARINSSDLQRLERYKLREGDILFSRKGNVERRALVRSQEADWLQGSDCIRLRILTNDIEPTFVSYALGTKAYREWILRNAQGATMPSLNQEIIGRIPLPLPKSSEQRAIMGILATLDDKIELNMHMNETLAGMTNAVFKSWFVDFDPVRSKTESGSVSILGRYQGLFPNSFQDSELGNIPTGWRVARLGDLCGRVAMGPFGSDIKADNFVEAGVPVIRGGNLTHGFVDEGFVYISEQKADELRNSNAFPGDIVITHRGTLGQVGLIPKRSRFPRYVVSQSQMLLSVDDRQATTNYIFVYLSSVHGQHQLLANTNQTGVPAIARPVTSLKAIRLVLPPPTVLKSFEELVGPLIDRIDANLAETRSLISLRDMLLSQLISGKLRLRDCEKALL